MKDLAEPAHRALIAEAIRRANWAATQGPLHLRAGRFVDDRAQPETPSAVSRRA